MCNPLHNLQFVPPPDYNAGMAPYCKSNLPRAVRALSVSALIGICSPVHGIRWTDFRQKTATNAWSLAGTTYSADRGLKFAEVGAFAQRADFGGPVTSVVVVTYCSGTRLEEPFTVAAGASPGALVDREPPIAYVYTKYATNVFDFAAGEDVRAVRVRSNAETEVKGNYYLTAVGVGWEGEASQPDPPSAEDAPPVETLLEDAETMWRVSDFTGGTMREDFAWTTNVAKATPWTNGVTIAGFHALKNGVALTRIGKDSGRATSAGLYASRSADPGGPWSLSMLGSSANDIALELRVLNDRIESLDGAHVAFDAYQWTFPESPSRTMSFAWAVTRTPVRPAEAAWRVDGEAGFASLAAPTGKASFAVSSRVSQTRGTPVPGGGVLWLRWLVPRGAACPMLGVGDVRLTLAFRRATAIFVR